MKRLHAVKPFSRKKLQKNIAIFVVFIWICMLVLVGRFAWLQIVKGDVYAELAKSNATADMVRQTPRGKITDRNGRELAISRMTSSLFVDPYEVKDPEKLASELSEVIHVPEKEILDDIAVGGRFVWVKRQMEGEDEKAVRKFISDNNYYNCLGFQEEVKRYYPNDMLAANVIGFVGGADNGLAGIEHSFDALIKGAAEEETLTTDQRNRPILGDIFRSHRYAGDRCKDITLTLEANVQFIVEQALDKVMEKNQPKAVTAIVMDPSTGEILAMASRPSFNPNKYWESRQEDMGNRAVSFIYEPGSTFKAMVAGAALQEKAVTPNQTFVDPGFVMVSDRRIQNWNGESFGTISFTDVVKNSVNTGFAQVGLQLGGEKLTSYAKSFGFGAYTGIEIPGEECGLLFEPADMRDSDIATMAIGQSIAVTPLQLITAMSAIANDGILLKPHVIKKINNADGSVFKEYGREEVHRTLESATVKTLTGLLEQVVATGGGQLAGVKGYRIAGKTGTAQKIREDGAGYMEGRYIASFCGFAPVENPRFTVLVMIDDPSGLFYGGQIAAPVAGEIFSQLFRYYHVEPSSDPFAEEDNKLPAPAVPKQQPAEPRSIPEGKVMIPDLKGCSIREASQKLAEIGVAINAEGSGIAVAQDVPAYAVVDPNITVTVFFSP